MALPALAVIEDLAVRLGVDGSQIDDARAQACLDDASVLVRAELDQTWVDVSGELIVAGDGAVPDVARFVVLASAKRAYENPSGITSKTASDVTIAFQARPATGVYLTEEERALLHSTEVGTTGGLWTLETYRGDLCIGDTVWVPVVDAPPFPFLTSEDV